GTQLLQAHHRAEGALGRHGVGRFGGALGRGLHPADDLGDRRRPVAFGLLGAADGEGRVRDAVAVRQDAAARAEAQDGTRDIAAEGAQLHGLQRLRGAGRLGLDAGDHLAVPVVAGAGLLLAEAERTVADAVADRQQRAARAGVARVRALEVADARLVVRRRPLRDRDVRHAVGALGAVGFGAHAEGGRRPLGRDLQNLGLGLGIVAVHAFAGRDPAARVHREALVDAVVGLQRTG